MNDWADDPYKGRVPTEEECWNNFWAIMGPALYELHLQGKLPTDEEIFAEASAPPAEPMPRPYTTRQVREWLAREGRPAPPRGRIANRTMREYEVAHGYVGWEDGPCTSSPDAPQH